MAFTLATSLSSIEAFDGALGGTAVGSLTMAQVNADITANGGLNNTLNAYYLAGFGSTPAATVAAIMAKNMGIVSGTNGLVDADVKTATDYITGQLTTASASKSQGVTVMTILNLFAGLSSDTGQYGKEFGVTATAWNATVSNSVAYEQSNANDVTLAAALTAVTAAKAAATALANAPATFTLTNGNNPTTGGVDNIVGTAGNDKINGILDVTAGQPNGSFESSDIIDGGDGTDSLNLTVIGALAGGPVAGVVTNVETINLNNASSATAPSYAMDNVTGATTINLTGSLDATTLTLTGLQNIVDVGLAGSGGLTMTYLTTATVGSSDVQKLALNGSIEGLTKSNIFTADGIETIAITGNKDSKVTVLGNTVKAITIAGAAKITVADNDATLKTVDGSAATGNTTIVIGANPVVTSIKAGSGDDTITLTNSLTKNISVDGGAGNDTLQVGNTSFASDAFANVKNIETIGLNATAAVSIDLSSVVGVNKLSAQLTQTTAAVSTAETSINTLITDTEAARVNNQDGATPPAVGAGTLGAAYQQIATIVDVQEASSTPFKLQPVFLAGGTYGLLNAGAAASPAIAYANIVALAKTGTTTINNLTSGSTVSLSSQGLKAVFATDPLKFDLLGQAAVTATVLNASLPANTSDSLSINMANDNLSTVKNTALGSVSAAKNLYVVDSVNVPNVETININSTGSFGGNEIDQLVTLAANKIVITGDQALTIGASTIGSGAGIQTSTTDSVSFDASALKGKLSVTMTGTELNHYDGGLIGGAGAADGLTVMVASGAALLPKTTGFESLTLRPATIAAATSVDVSGVAGVSKATLVTTTGAGGEVLTLAGLSTGYTVNLQGTSGTDSLTFQGAGANSTLNLNVNEDTTKDALGSNGSAWSAGTVTLARVGSVTLDVTRVDGTDANSVVAQQATTIGALNSTTLKTLTVVGPNDAGNVLKLGDVNNAVTSLLSSIDMSGFAGTIGTNGLNLQNIATGSKDITITLNKATSAGTAPVLATDAGVGAVGKIASTVAVAGINLGDFTVAGSTTTAGSTVTDNISETIKLSSGFTGNLVISGFSKGSGASVASHVDKLDFSAMGVSLGDLTFQNFANQVNANLDQPDDSLQITSTLFTGTITLLGVLSTDITNANLQFV